jgi:hypothetical protein
MSKPSEKWTAREFVWEHRLRQRIAFERIILTVGKPREKSRAQQFLEAMERANPELFEGIEQYTLDLFSARRQYTPELFDESEYSRAQGRRTALKLPRDILWEERIIRRSVREFGDLFHPCEPTFKNAMKGLRYLKNLHPELFSRARALAIEQRDRILTSEFFCPCNCATVQDRQAAESFRIADRGRFKTVSKRITAAKLALESTVDSAQSDWRFFLDRIRDVAPEMLEG